MDRDALSLSLTREFDTFRPRSIISTDPSPLSGLGIQALTTWNFYTCNERSSPPPFRVERPNGTCFDVIVSMHHKQGKQGGGRGGRFGLDSVCLDLVPVGRGAAKRPVVALQASVLNSSRPISCIFVAPFFR